MSETGSTAAEPKLLKLSDLREAAAGDAKARARVSEALRKGQEEDLRPALERLEPFEAARLLMRLRPKAARKLIRLMPEMPSLALLSELDPGVVKTLFDASQIKRIARVVSKLPKPDAAQFLQQAPADLRTAILDELGNPEDLAAALHYDEESAGAVMQRRLVAVPQTWTIGHVIDEIRTHSDAIDRLYAIYVIDEAHRLIGFLKVRDLLLNPPEALVSDVMRRDPVSVTASTDREEVAKFAASARLPVLPVVDADGVLLGRVTAKELRAIERAEAEEDMKIMSGLAPETSAADGPLKIVPRRLPWLLGGLIGSGTAAIIVGAYEDALARAAILATLIPIVMSLAGNAGIQASTVTVQALSSGKLWVGDLWGRIMRETVGGLLNGASVGIVVTVLMLAISLVVPIDRPLALGLTATLTLITVTVQASVVGSMVPIMLDKLGFDPAVATGVFITTSNDMIGVLIFFLIASALYL